MKHGAETPKRRVAEKKRGRRGLLNKSIRHRNGIRTFKSSVVSGKQWRFQCWGGLLRSRQRTSLSKRSEIGGLWQIRRQWPKWSQLLPIRGGRGRAKTIIAGKGRGGTGSRCYTMGELDNGVAHHSKSRGRGISSLYMRRAEHN